GRGDTRTVARRAVRAPARGRSEHMTQPFDLGPDWVDVVHRARRAGRARRALEFASLLALIVVGIASAYALGHPVIDFGSAKHAGVHEVDEFGSMQVAAPRGMA